MNNTYYKKILYLLTFCFVGYIALQIKFTNVIGTDVSFTLFDFFAPTAAAFLGGPLGLLTIFLVGLINLATHWNGLELVPFIRLFPTLFAVLYFALPQDKKEGKLIIIVPSLAMILFWLHPVGRQVWYYALLWLIPIASYFKRNYLFIRSLGATMTAHSVGGAAFIWAIQIPAEVWQGLLPVVIIERILMAIGISLSYLMLINMFKYLKKKLSSFDQINIEEHYS